MTTTVLGANVQAGGFRYEAVPAAATAIVTPASTQLILTQLGWFNDNAAPAVAYLQLFNQAAALAGGESPVITFLLTPLSSGIWTPARNGEKFNIGLVFGVSSTRDTYTASATPIFLFVRGVATLN